MLGRWLLVGLVTIAPAVPATAQEFPSPTLHVLLPADYPYPIRRVCSTAWGICALPLTIPPGQPCVCQAVNGAWVSGACIR